MNTNSVQIIDSTVIQTIQVNTHFFCVIEGSKCWTHHWCGMWNCTDQAWAIWDLSNRNLLWIILYPGSQKRITLSVESISTMPFQARGRDVKIPEWGQHCRNCGMPFLVSIFGTIWRRGDQPNKNPGVLFRWTADIISNIPDCEIKCPGMRVARTIGYVGLVGYTNHWHNRRTSRKLILQIPAPISCVHLVYIWPLSKSARRTCSKLWCTWNGRCTKRNWIHLKISR
jgi:hypothetical protein